MPFSENLHEHSFLFAPGECLLCHEQSGRKRDLCHACEQEITLLRTSCRYCAEPMASANGICANCLMSPPPFSAVLSAFHYRHPADYLMQLFKDSGNRAAGYVLTKLAIKFLYQDLQSIRSQAPLMTSVPLHRSKLRQRGFNQSELIADWLSPVLDFPCNHNLVKRVRRTESQRNLDERSRRKNLRGAFRIDTPALIRNRTILLVDDVVTTTSTIREISDVLLKAGAADVIVFSLARTPSQR